MSIPEKVKIDSVTYQISVASEPLLVNYRECKGRIDYDKNQILVRDFLGESA